jgi:hypothetical protein
MEGMQLATMQKDIYYNYDYRVYCTQYSVLIVGCTVPLLTLHH